jgi:hypothetical protein
VISDGTMIDNEGTFAVGAGSACDLEVPLTNTSTGKVDVKGSLYPTKPVVNDGSFKVEEGGGLFDNGVAGPAMPFTNDASGTVTNDGTFDIGGTTFTSDGDLGGTQPITLINSTLDDQAGAGAFLLEGTDTVTGTVPAGQTLAVRGSVSGNGELSLGGDVLTNDGTITLGSVSGNGSWGWIATGGSGGALVNNGTIVLLAPPSGLSSCVGVLDAPVTNAAGGTILVQSPSAYLGLPSGYGSGVTLTNNGTLTFAAGAELKLEGGDSKPSQGSSIVMSAMAVFNVTVDGLAGAPAPVAAVVQGSYAPVGTLALGGTFSVTTLGGPHGTFSVVTGLTVSGSFAGLEFGIHAYKVTTTGTSVSVATTKAFTLTAENFSGTAGQPVNTALATLTGSSSAKYAVSVAWGDGTTSAGTFAAAKGGGTVSGAHTYASAGTYTVTTTVACSNGTTRTAISTATIATG